MVIRVVEVIFKFFLLLKSFTFFVAQVTVVAIIVLAVVVKFLCKPKVLLLVFVKVSQSIKVSSTVALKPKLNFTLFFLSSFVTILNCSSSKEVKVNKVKLTCGIHGTTSFL